MNGFRNALVDALSAVGSLQIYPKMTLWEGCGCGPDKVALILSGRIRQFFIGPKGVEKTVLLLRRGDLLGDLEALGQDRDQEGLFSQALTDVTLRQMTAGEFLAPLEAQASVARAVQVQLARKLAIAMAQIHDISFCEVQERLRRLLIRLAHQQGVATAQGIKIPYRYTHEDLAAMVGSTRSTVTRKMKALEEEGVFRIRGRLLYIQEASAIAGGPPPGS